jgi:hypothetical protein
MADSESTSCLVCGQSFTLLRRRHHCRQCGRLVCNDCSETQTIEYSTLTDDKNSKEKRVCTQCFAKNGGTKEGRVTGAIETVAQHRRRAPSTAAAAAAGHPANIHLPNELSVQVIRLPELNSGNSKNSILECHLFLPEVEDWCQDLCDCLTEHLPGLMIEHASPGNFSAVFERMAPRALLVPLNKVSDEFHR